MSDQQKYDQVFMETFEVTAEELTSLRYKEVELWDSVGQITLLAALEDSFGITLGPDEMMDLDSYESGKQLLRDNHGLEL